jgi:hypothetical protein
VHLNFETKLRLIVIARNARKMQRMRISVAVLLSIAACGGGQEAKPPQPNQTTDTDASLAPAATDAAAASSTSATTADAAVASTADAAPMDDVDKSVSVCGDEAVPLEKRIRKKVKECWQTAASRDPSIDGHVQVAFVVDGKGKITKIDIPQAKTLGGTTATCITTAVMSNKLDGTKCVSKTVKMEMAFGRAAKD